MATLLTVEEAWRQILSRVRALPAETIPLASAAGRVLAADAPSAVDLPPFASSAMDGFAVRADETPGTFPVVERVAAGRPATRALAAGEAMAIATGGVVPAGADAVVPIEAVVQSDNSIEIDTGVAPGAHVRP
ncbi:MAG: molybdopterin molybdenumtransferase MoeA, partial [Myxococcales bacterium]